MKWSWVRQTGRNMLKSFWMCSMCFNHEGFYIRSMDKQEVLERLKSVVDPELGIDIVNLGLIYDIKIEGDSIHVKMTLTSPFCPLGVLIVRNVEEVLKSIGFKNVDIEIVFDPPWTPSRMSEEAKKKLGWKDEDKGG